MRQYFFILFSVLILLHANRSTAADSDFPNAVPREIKSLFVDAPDSIDLKTISSMPKAELPRKYWIDNHRIIFNSRDFQGWKAAKDEKSKIIVFNVDTGVAEETPYRGNLHCFSSDGQILIQDYQPSKQPGDTNENSQFFLQGKFGEKLNRYKRTKEQGYSDKFSCQTIAVQMSDEKIFNQPLHPWDGFLKRFDVPSSSVESKIQLINSEGKIAWSITTDFCNPFQYALTYAPWSGTYFSGATFGAIAPGCPNADKLSWLFSQNSIESKSLPKLVEQARIFGHGLGGYGGVFWARRGMYLSIQFSVNKLLDGLYWEDSDAGLLKRILKKPWTVEALSPNGCRGLVMVTPPVVLELCKDPGST